MKKILYFTLMAAACLVSCVNTIIDEQPAVDEQPLKGSLSFTVTDPSDFIIVTKATDYMDYSNYDVVIDGPDKINEKFSTFRGRIVELGSGHYTITVTSPDTEPAAFEQPIYQASTEFDIRAGEVTDITLEMKPINCKVTFKLTDNFKKELSTYEAVVSNGLGELTWRRDLVKDDFAAGLAGYFLPRGLVINIKGHRSIDDSEATAQYIVENPKAAEHHIVTLDADVTGQIGGVTIKIVEDFNDVSQDINIGGLDETYVDRPDFDGSEGAGGEEESTLPVIIWDANPFFDGSYPVSEGTVLDMNVKAAAGIKTFKVEVSDNFKDAIKTVTKGKYGEENAVPYIDLIGDADIWSAFQGLPAGDAVKDQTQLNFTLTPFVSMLLAVCDPGMLVEFTLLATDNNDEPILTSSQALPVVSIKIVK